VTEVSKTLAAEMRDHKSRHNDAENGKDYPNGQAGAFTGRRRQQLLEFCLYSN
jgi:hypothetical protein